MGIPKMLNDRLRFGKVIPFVGSEVIYGSAGW